MKRYLVFGWNDYEPDGGWDDFAGHYDSLPAAKRKAREFGRVGEVVDSQTGKVVFDRTSALKAKEEKCQRNRVR